MTNHHTHAAARPVSSEDFATSDWLALLDRWLQRARTRRALDALDPHLLADVALSERARVRECRKWFWQD
jgi:uncharacterized protein YjiS (DUF1127 family)